MSPKTYRSLCGGQCSHITCSVTKGTHNWLVTICRGGDWSGRLVLNLASLGLQTNSQAKLAQDVKHNALQGL